VHWKESERKTFNKKFWKKLRTTFGELVATQMA
jgi:hypothetical protein